MDFKGKTAAIILAGGSSTRIGGKITKQRLLFGGISVLKMSVLAFECCIDIDEIIVVVKADELDYFKAELAGIKKIKAITVGGETRVKSAIAGFSKVSADCDYVAVHDAARPLITPPDISKVIGCAKEKGAAFAAAPMYDTVKQLDNTGKVAATVNRSTLVRATTPQIFKCSLYKLALEAAYNSAEATDDCMLLENIGIPAYAVLLEKENPKITTVADVEYFKYLLGEVN